MLQQQYQSQSEHIESLLSECKGNLEKVDHQETGEKMKTLKVKKLLNYSFEYYGVSNPFIILKWLHHNFTIDISFLWEVSTGYLY